jgi:alpha-beta hydrolase superfamily lysophospholipase
MEKNHTKLAYTIFKPKGEIKECMLIVQGMEEQRKCYKYFANVLKNSG